MVRLLMNTPLLCAVALLTTAGVCCANPITLIHQGRCDTAIHVPPEIMNDTGRARASVEDLAHYLGRMTGVTVPVHTRRPRADGMTTPILIGSYADEVFGPIDMQTEFRQGLRLVVSSEGVGMQGETDEGLSHAIYELLDMLGCRWYLPGELGEVIPYLPTLTLAPMDRRRTPGTASRNVWYADDAFKRRNRLGGFAYSSGHALEGYVSREQLEQNPEWQAERDGRRDLYKVDVGYHLCWGNPEVSTAVGDTIIARLDARYADCMSVSPGDYGHGFCECDLCTALDAGDWDPSMATPSMTDRYVNFINRIAERVAERHPEVKLGFLAYVQYTRPPLRETLHPNVIPQIAPITYCRAHTLDDETCPTRPDLQYILEGWGKAARHVAMYEYLYHLAEVSAPFPMIARNTVELPIQYANNITMWTPETLPNLDTSLPGFYLGVRMSVYTDADPQAILDEFYSRFYGTAAGTMRAYWEYVDSLWTQVPEHAGCGFGYMRRFSPERLEHARVLMDHALAVCRTAMEYRRVRLADDSLRQFELFMKMRRDYFGGRFDQLEADSKRWTTLHQHLADRYADNYAFTRTFWARQTVAVYYNDMFFFQSYADATRVARDYLLLTPALNVWRYAVDREEAGEQQGWDEAAFDDSQWEQTDVSVDTWAHLGLMGYYGSMWYRSRVQLPALPEDKRVYLWIGATDGRAQVFVNGHHVPFVNDRGEEVAYADGYCRPFSFDVTGVVEGDSENQVTIIGTRHFINELGTGGLLGPVVIYREP